jgi:uncharacterized protein YndB with AHSA1/START domain
VVDITRGAATTDDQMVVIERVLNAPRELVFRAWTDPDQLLQWFAPDGCQIRYRHVDIREGGAFHSCILTPEGHDCWCKGVYREVVAPERIVFTMEVSDADGGSPEPAAVGMDRSWPRETTVTVTLADLGNQTKLTLHQTVSENLAKRTGAHPSWLNMLDRLEARLLHSR